MWGLTSIVHHLATAICLLLNLQSLVLSLILSGSVPSKLSSVTCQVLDSAVIFVSPLPLFSLFGRPFWSQQPSPSSGLLVTRYHTQERGGMLRGSSQHRMCVPRVALSPNYPWVGPPETTGIVVITMLVAARRDSRV